MTKVERVFVTEGAVDITVRYVGSVVGDRRDEERIAIRPAGRTFAFPPRLHVLPTGRTTILLIHRNVVDEVSVRVGNDGDVDAAKFGNCSTLYFHVEELGVQTAVAIFDAVSIASAIGLGKLFQGRVA